MVVGNIAVNVPVRDESHSPRRSEFYPEQSKWILWWKKWQWSRLILRVLRVFLFGVSPPTFCIHTHDSFIYRRRHINLGNLAPYERVTRIHVSTVTHRKSKCLDILLNTDVRGKNRTSESISRSDV